jgi:sugar lactone lactonase YvrE
MREDGLELVIDAKALLGEGPCWDKEAKLLYWVDIIENNVHIFDPLLNRNRTIPALGNPSAVVPRKSGGVVLAMNRSFYALDLQTDQPTFLAGPPDEPTSNRFNDGKCDAMGRFWAGTMPFKGSDPTGSVYCLDVDLTVRHMFGKVRCSNGIAWSPDNTTMYYIDTPTKQVVAFDYHLASGMITNKRVVVSIPDGEGIPDGMTIDSEGMLWVAQWEGYKVSRWDPRDGTRLQVVPVPVARVTSCTFGGDQLDELYITTARIGLDENELVKQPHAGGVFKIKTNVRGVENYPFKG